MRFKTIASILAVALLSASMCRAADDNEKKQEKTRKMAAEALQDVPRALVSIACCLS